MLFPVKLSKFVYLKVNGIRNHEAVLMILSSWRYLNILYTYFYFVSYYSSVGLFASFVSKLEDRFIAISSYREYFIIHKP